MKKHKKKREKLAEGEELGVPWETFADGMPHRLKRNRDFPDIEPRTAIGAAMNAAKRMNMAVQAVPDTGRNYSRFLWVQFADYEIPLGEPCKCGGRQIVRFHQAFGRCAACDAQILFASVDTNATTSGQEDIYKREGLKFGWG